ncbi:MAG: 3-oxoacyl-[acyl-carrier-protein] synthase II [Natronomonas sp.]|jgi:3-oxoacyl-[acyl-carrier-protein] synthase II
MSTGPRRDPVVTGVGLVTPVGVGAGATWEACLTGATGAGRVQRFDTEEYRLRSTIACEVDAEFDDHERVDPRSTGRYTRMALVAADEALSDAGLDPDGEGWDPRDIGVAVASALGGIPTYEAGHHRTENNGRVSSRLLVQYLPNLAAGHLATEFDARGPNRAPATACAAGAHAVADAATDIRAGRADVVIAGGAESALTPTVVRAFDVMRALSTRNDDPGAASRPFDADRDGFVLSEGAGVVILEAREHAVQRGATGCATVSGLGLSDDASHPTRPPEDGRGLRAAMEQALDDANVPPDAVDLINAHATSTPVGDSAEAAAIGGLFGDDGPPVWAPKSSLGHPLGAAGAVETALTAQAIATGVVPPTVNHDRTDVDRPLRVLTERTELAPETVVTNAAGFGGTNASLVLRAVDNPLTASGTQTHA